VAAPGDEGSPSNHSELSYFNALWPLVKHPRAESLEQVELILWELLAQLITMVRWIGMRFVAEVGG
jgi:hypothetical protein